MQPANSDYLFVSPSTLTNREFCSIAFLSILKDVALATAKRLTRSTGVRFLLWCVRIQKGYIPVGLDHRMVWHLRNVIPVHPLRLLGYRAARDTTHRNLSTRARCSCHRSIVVSEPYPVSLIARVAHPFDGILVNRVCRERPTLGKPNVVRMGLGHGCYVCEHGGRVHGVEVGGEQDTKAIY